MAKDYYQILGIPKNASDEDIKKAFRKLAHEHHPDKAGGNEAKFKEINEAYQALGDREKRAQYDRFGRTFDGDGGPGGFGGFGFDPSQFGDMGDLGDIFGDIFSGFGFGGGSRKTYHRGSDLETRIDIALEEAFSGLKKKLRVETFIACETCAGAGYFSKEGFEVCKTCGGQGEIRETKKSFFGAFARVVQCSKCRGLGKIPEKICSKCAGGGRVGGIREIEINLAAGISDGQIIKVSGMGESGESGMGAGDLYVRVRVAPHPAFARVGDDLVTRQAISFLDILLEKPVKIKTIAGKNIEVSVPPDFNLKNKIKIAGEGMPRFGSWGRGDLYLDLDVKTPKKLNSEIKKLLEKLDKEI